VEFPSFLFPDNDFLEENDLPRFIHFFFPPPTPLYRRVFLAGDDVRLPLSGQVCNYVPPFFFDTFFPFPFSFLSSVKPRRLLVLRSHGYSLSNERPSSFGNTPETLNFIFYLGFKSLRPARVLLFCPGTPLKFRSFPPASFSEELLVRVCFSILFSIVLTPFSRGECLRIYDLFLPVRSEWFQTSWRLYATQGSRQLLDLCSFFLTFLPGSRLEVPFHLFIYSLRN